MLIRTILTQQCLDRKVVLYLVPLALIVTRGQMEDRLSDSEGFLLSLLFQEAVWLGAGSYDLLVCN
eukprot:1119216-Amphidinium_carterae.2